MTVVRLVIVLALVAVAACVAALASRREGGGAPVVTRSSLPTHVRRTDFARPDAAWLVVLFSSATCASCARARQVVVPLESSEVAVTEIEFSDERDLHERYSIDAVPSVIVCDADGAVRAGFLGPPTAADLWATLADLREPGSVPPGCDDPARGQGDQPID